MPDATLAAVLIDFENIFYFLKNQLPPGYDITDSIVEMLRALRQHLLSSFNEHILSMDAYADFDRIQENAQSELYLLGVETHNVLGTEHKNAADMRLCIDTLDILYNRPEIHTFALVAGDRDYIPVIKYLKKRARTVRVVGFPKGVSGDVLTIVGNDYFIDATQFVTALTDVTTPKESLPPTPSWRAAAPPQKQVTAHGTTVEAFSTTSDIVDHEGMMDWQKYETQAVHLLLTHFRNKPEVWLTPYLHKLRSELSELTEWERKQLITRLANKGAFKVEKRQGVPNDFSVLVVNWNSQLIRGLSSGL
jgi:uncharacterized LabA/DUF88 family protein